MQDKSENAQKPAKSPVALREEAVLAFWNKEHVFEKSVEKPAGLARPLGDFVFYDGPPFATGLPHYGHILAGTIKDAIPRHKTMRGYRVRRRWGWDCHGLPVENLIEKELGLSSKKDILTYGVGKFNAASRASVMRYADEWRKLVPRFGRFVDMKDDYQTMSPQYTESVWWAFKTLFDKGLVYEGFKSMHLCPHCETTLSNFEVTQGYKDITDISVYVKFELLSAAGEKTAPTYLIAWTTTPWTLPGNVALAVHPKLTYVKVEVTEAAKDGKPAPTTVKYVFVKEALEKVRKLAGDGAVFGAAEEVPASELVGMSYRPIFDYYSVRSFGDEKLENRANGWKIYAADFVTTDTGTGIVHIAPAFGTDDYELAQKEKLPFVQHVGTDGRFKKEVTDFAGQSVKPKSSAEEKDAHQRADIEIIKYLARQGNLFAKEKLIHSYPHCWRCDTPLLNYAASSWFVKVASFKDKLVAANKKVRWVPEEVGEGRFGNWLENARDWAISRSRFWGAPLPVWKDEKTGECEVLGSVADLRARSHARNNYFIMRHGESDHNVQNVMDSKISNKSPLTERGRTVAREQAAFLKDKKIDLIITSPILRTKQTAAIAAEVLGFDKNKIIEDKRIIEVQVGVYEGRSVTEYRSLFKTNEEYFTKTPEGGENFSDIRRRVGDFIYDLESKYEGKNILIVSHDSPLWLLDAVAHGRSLAELTNTPATDSFLTDFISTGEVKALDFKPLPHNADYELDLHRPFIDDVKLVSKRGNRLVRVPEVFDCWFESGAMPFGEAHYPFDKADFDPKGKFSSKIFGSKGFPADFIAEGLDQTRGWFYSMLVLGVGLFGRSPYKQVIVNGLILAEDGQKMSKSKKNYADPMDVVDKYGADAVRYYMLASPVVRGQDFCFSEKGVDEVVKKHIGRLNNVLSFYEMYADKNTHANPIDMAAVAGTTNVLDRWILARLSELSGEVTTAMESYELDKATRPFADFIDDLSTWYIRRSRDRFKAGDTDSLAALGITRYVLMTTAQLLAPFMPFLAEDIYGRLRSATDSQSVHLSAWPADAVARLMNMNDRKTTLDLMRAVRDISSLGLEARSRAKINVRQPLATLTVTSSAADAVLHDRLSKAESLVALIKDEVNVRAVAWKVGDAVISTPTTVTLDTNLTPELKEEGVYRELVRVVQDLRKKEGLTVSDRVSLVVSTDEKGRALVEKFKKELSDVAGLKEITFGDAAGNTSTEEKGEEIRLADSAFGLSLKR